MMAMQNSRISYFGNIARLKKAIHTHRESDPLCVTVSSRVIYDLAVCCESVGCRSCISWLLGGLRPYGCRVSVIRLSVARVSPCWMSSASSSWLPDYLVCCMQDTFAATRPSARATIGCLVYNLVCVARLTIFRNGSMP